MLTLLVAHKSSLLLNATRSFPDTSELWRRSVGVIAQHKQNTALNRLWASLNFIIIITCNSRTWSQRLYEVINPEPGLYCVCLPNCYSSLYVLMYSSLCTQLCPSIGIWMLENRFLISTVAQIISWNGVSCTCKPQVSTERISLPFKSYREGSSPEVLKIDACV